jgi:hypothetical protein
MDMGTYQNVIFDLSALFSAERLVFLPVFAIWHQFRWVVFHSIFIVYVVMLSLAPVYYWFSGTDKIGCFNFPKGLFYGAKFTFIVRKLKL